MNEITIIQNPITKVVEVNVSAPGARGQSAYELAVSQGYVGTLADWLLSLQGSGTGGLSGADRAKLDGIATGATANATDSALRDRGTHTGTQGINTITGLQAVIDSKQDTLVSATNITYSNGRVISWIAGGYTYGVSYGADGVSGITRNGLPYKTITYTNGLVSGITIL